MTSRRRFLGLAAAILLAGCAQPSGRGEFSPIVFVHGNGDSAALWMTTLWRFESNGWPRDRLHAIDFPYPLARDDDRQAQPGRSSSGEQMAFLRAEVEKTLASTGARQVVLYASSRGGYAVRNYIQNGGGDRTVSHAILGGTPNHGVWSIKGYNEGSEFSGTGPFLSALNAPKNAGGDEVTGPVKWLTIRSDSNDKYAQPDAAWIGAKGQPTGVTYAGPELKGAASVVIARADHRETALSPAAFDAAWRFITGRAPSTLSILPQQRPVLSGKVSGLGAESPDPRGGGEPDNLPLAGARLEVFAIDPTTGERRGAPAYTKTIGADGLWGPMRTQAGSPYEFVISAPGHAITHIYRSPFPRSSTLVQLRAERIAAADRDAAAIVTMARPRGYLDPTRDRMSLDGQSPPPGVPPGAGISSSTIKPAAVPRPVAAEFNGEKVVGRVWPAAQGHVTILELHY